MAGTTASKAMLTSSGKLADDLDGRLAVTSARADGWQHSSSRSDTNGAVGYYGARGSLNWKPLSTVRVNLTFNGWQDHSQPEAQQLIAIDPASPKYASEALLSAPLSPLHPSAADWSTGAARPRSDRAFGAGRAAHRRRCHIRSRAVVTDVITTSTASSRVPTGTALH